MVVISNLLNPDLVFKTTRLIAKIESFACAFEMISTKLGTTKQSYFIEG